IWPLHAVTLIAAIWYLAWKNGVHFLRLDAILANIFLVHGWGHYFLPSFNFPSWSLSCEWGAYLLLPMLLFVAGRFKAPAIHAGVIVGSFVLLVVYVLHVSGGSGNLDLREQYGLPRCLFEVVIGVGLYRLYAIVLQRRQAGSDGKNGGAEKLWDFGAL